MNKKLKPLLMAIGLGLGFSAPSMSNDYNCVYITGKCFTYGLYCDLWDEYCSDL